MSWVCFAATGPGHLALTESTVKSSEYQSVLRSNAKLAKLKEQLKQLCKEEWGKIPPRQCERLIKQDDIRLHLVFHMTVQEKAEALQVCQYLLIYFQLVTLAVQKQKFPVCSVVYSQLLL